MVHFCLTSLLAQTPYSFVQVSVLRQMKGFDILEICETTNNSSNAHWNSILRKI